MRYLAGIVACLLVLLLTPLVAAVAHRLGIVDHVRPGRKVHRRTTPLMGGVGIWLACAGVIAVVLWRSNILTQGEVGVAHYVGLLLAALVLVVGGVVDDRWSLKPLQQIGFPIVAALIAIAGGLGVAKITNPFGGVFLFETMQWHLFWLGAHPVVVSWPGDVFVFVWLLGMMFTVKLLDGLDGLATSIGAVGVWIVLLLAGTAAYFQPDVQMLAYIILGALLGFLAWNWHPARIFLGEGGALLIGFLLGALAIISGGKIATLLLVMGVPILDVVWVLWRRWKSGARVSQGDRRHLHHRLYDLGLTQPQVVLLYAVIALGCGLLTLVLPSVAKLIALGMLGIGVGGGAYLLLYLEETDKKQQS